MDTYEIQYDSIEVFPDGRQVVLVIHRGVFLIHEQGFELLHGAQIKYGDEENDDARNETNSKGANESSRPDCVPAEAVWNISCNE